MAVTNEVWTVNDFKRFTQDKVKPETQKKSKFNNTKVEADGLTFDSKKEYGRYIDLKAQEKLGYITDVKHHVVFKMDYNGIHICNYEADFTYIKKGELVVEDVKSTITASLPTYRLKKKMMKAFHGIEIKEV